jgi:hypothetical protein
MHRNVRVVRFITIAVGVIGGVALSVIGVAIMAASHSHSASYNGMLLCFGGVAIVCTLVAVARRDAVNRRKGIWSRSVGHCS